MKITELDNKNLQEAPYGLGAKTADVFKGLVPGIGNTLKGVKQTADSRRALGDFMNTVKRDYAQDMKLSKQPTTQQTLMTWLQKEYPFGDYKAKTPTQDVQVDKTTPNDTASNTTTTTTTPNDTTATTPPSNNVDAKPGDSVTYRSQKNPNGADAEFVKELPNGKVQLSKNNAIFAIDKTALTGKKDSKAQNMKKDLDQAVSDKGKKEPEVVNADLVHEQFELQFQAMMEQEKPISGKQVDATINDYVTQMYKAGAVEIDPKNPQNLRHVAGQFKKGAAALDKAGEKFGKVYNMGGLDSKLDSKDQKDSKQDNQASKAGLSRLRQGIGLENPNLALAAMNKIAGGQTLSVKEREAMAPLVVALKNTLASDSTKLAQVLAQSNKK